MTVPIIDLLNSRNYRTYNLKVARALGSINAAIFIGDLIDRYYYHKENGELKKFNNHTGEWFYYQIDKCEERTMLSRKEQDGAWKLISAFGFFDKQLIGVPAKRHFRINIEKINAFFSNSNNDYSLSKRDKLECPKGTNCIVQKGQTINEPYNEPKDTTTSSSFSEKEKIMKEAGLNENTIRNSSKYPIERIQIALHNTRLKKDLDNINAYFFDQLKNGYPKKDDVEEMLAEEQRKKEEIREKCENIKKSLEEKEKPTLFCFDITDNGVVLGTKEIPKFSMGYCDASLFEQLNNFLRKCSLQLQSC